jgi:hypothetical protein
VRAAYEGLQAKDVIAVGIDAPLFWVANGCRVVDGYLRERIRTDRGADASNTVLQVNSLRGACLVQGILAGVLSRERTPGVRISESHPKAALWLRIGRDPAEVRLTDLNGLFNPPNDWHQNDRGDHLRDAALACLSAWAMVHAPEDWRNLYPIEQTPYSPIAAPLAYWMPEVVP